MQISRQIGGAGRDLVVVGELVQVAILFVEVGVGSDRGQFGVDWAGRVDPGLRRRCLMRAPWDAEALNKSFAVPAQTLLHSVSDSATHSDSEVPINTVECTMQCVQITASLPFHRQRLRTFPR